MGFNVLEQTENCINWIRKWFEHNGDENSKAIIGISGGIDSSTTAALCVKALGKDRVIGIMLPNGIQTDIDASQLLVKHLGIKHYTINIGDTYHALVDEMRVLAENGKEWPGDQYITNTPARIRMTALFGAAAMIGNCFVANTCNISESSQGYDTIFGDNVGSFAPIAKFTKTEVRKIAKFLELPETLVNKTPIDGMSLNTDGSYKSDEDKLGFTYEELDKTIRNIDYRGPNYDKIVNGFIRTAWKRRIVNIESYDPELDEYIETKWGWESEFLKIEFIDVRLRNEFDAEVEKIKESKEYQEDFIASVRAVWRLVEDCDPECVKYSNEELNQSIWDYIQEFQE